MLGVDDFALRKGDSYATILWTRKRRRRVKFLPGGKAKRRAACRRGNPEWRIIARDGAEAYAQGARSGAPQAVQVDDAWHLWHNLGDAADKTVAAHHTRV
ncbi:transposase, partial [Saccharothrix sp. ST-888]|uniref:transposase n=1 Tax=Saccharothrix sp. ST-888 TaxID=1427391 RepID=UPI001E5A0333